jgi:ribosomal protein L3 glutamine methyltransferase
MTNDSQTAVVGTLATIRDYIRWASSRFAEAGLCFGHGTATAFDEAAALVLHTLHQPHDLPALYLGAALTPEERARIVDRVEQRIAERKPLAYLLGEARFGGLPFRVDDRVLVPRSPLAELILNRFVPWIDPEEVQSILDLCTGSGCIAILCARVFPEARVDAVDVSGEALAVASENVQRHGVEDAVELIESDLFAGVEDTRYDILVSNPPYVSRGEWEALPAEYHAEPRLGLEAGEDGLDCVRRILAEALHHLNPEGILVVEVGSGAEALMAAYPAVPFTWLEFEHGGDGVFLLTARQLTEYRDVFESGERRFDRIPGP